MPSVLSCLPSAQLPITKTRLGPAAKAVLGPLPQLPLPGHGQTLERWQTLADIGGLDVCLAKVLEAHYDAQAILAEIAESAPRQHGLMAVWAAEIPGKQLIYTHSETDLGMLSGSKGWCSGADLVDAALVTTVCGDHRQLVLVELDQAEVSTPDSAWDAVGMSRVVSGDLHFDGAKCRPIGGPDAYLQRPGFWHGGAGVAACWYGAAAAIAMRLSTSTAAKSSGPARTHLGAIDMQMRAVRALFRELAARIDAEPASDHRHDVIRLRSLVERLCVLVLDRVARALGPGPLCADHAHAQRCADLAVFIRQSHAEHDWDALGGYVSAQGPSWQLT